MFCSGVGLVNVLFGGLLEGMAAYRRVKKKGVESLVCVRGGGFLGLGGVCCCPDIVSDYTLVLDNYEKRIQDQLIIQSCCTRSPTCCYVLRPHRSRKHKAVSENISLSR